MDEINIVVFVRKIAFIGHAAGVNLIEFKASRIVVMKPVILINEINERPEESQLMKFA